MKKTSIRDGFLDEINLPDSCKKTLTRKACSSCSGGIKEFYFNTKLGWLCPECLISLLRISCESERIELWPVSEIEEALSENGSIPKKLAVIKAFPFLYGDFPGAESAEEGNKLTFMLLDNIFYPLKKQHPLATVIQTATRDACKELKKVILSYIMVLWEDKSPEKFELLCKLAVYISDENPRLQYFISKAAISDNREVRQIAGRFLSSRVKHTSYEETIYEQEYVHSDRSRLLPLYLLENILHSYYGIHIMESIYNRYLVQVKSLGIKLPQGKVSFSVMLNVFAEVLLKEEPFRELMGLLPGKVKSLFEYLTWEGEIHSVKSLEKEFNCRIFTGKLTYKKFDLINAVDTDYLIIPVSPILIYEYGYYSSMVRDIFLVIPCTLADYLKKWIPAPPEYNLLPFEKIPDTVCLFRDEGKILEKFNVIFYYLAQEGVQITAQGKISLTFLKKFLKATGLEEFYNSGKKEFFYARSRLLVGLLQDKVGKIRNIEDPADFLKKLLTGFFTFSDNRNYKLIDLLDYLKEGAYYEWVKGADSERKARAEFFNLLKSMQEGVWYALEDLFKYTRYRSMELDIIERTPGYHHQYSYIITGDRQGKTVQTTHSLNTSNYSAVVILPLLKTLFALAASFGMIDLAYEFPVKTGKKETPLEYLSLYDSLKYVRLTPLGAYITGASENPGISVKRVSAVLTLDERRLYIYLDASDPVKQMLLEKLAEKVNDTCYKVTFSSFLKGCADELDIQNRITFFRNNIAAAPPPVWEAFLETVKSRLEPLVYQKQYLVFRLKENRELAALFASDKILSKYALKAENYHILVARNDISRIRKRLEEFGYFLQAETFHYPV